MTFDIENKHKVDDVLEVKVKRIVPFGIFVELEVGLEGLVHISNITNRRIGTPNEVVKVGDYVNAKITSIDVEAKKIELSMKALEEEKIEE